MTALLGYALMIFGAALLVVAMVGVLRLPDTLARQHAGTKAATLALGLMALGLALVVPSAGAWTRLGLLIVALWVTLPVASHALARAAISRRAKAERRA
jgi:multicomponent Na+:H+ antiporter subunit G